MYVKFFIELEIISKSILEIITRIIRGTTGRKKEKERVKEKEGAKGKRVGTCIRQNRPTSGKTNLKNT